MIDSNFLIFLVNISILLLFAGVFITSLLTPRKMLSFKFTSVFLGSYFYIFLNFTAQSQMGGYLENTDQFLSLAIILLTYVAIVIAQPSVKCLQSEGTTIEYDWNMLWYISIAVAIIGFAGTYSFTSQSERDWKNTSAYWYMTFHATYPSIALMLWASLKTQGREGRIKLICTGVIAFACLVPFIITVRRGPMFPMAIVLLFTPSLALRRSPSRFMLLSGLAATGFLMLLFVTIRDYSVSSDRQWNKIFSLNLADPLLYKARNINDNEFLYHCYLVTSSYRSGLYQYGTSYLNLAVCWIPRQLWPDKPDLSVGWFESPMQENRVFEVVGNALSGGAAAGGIANVFLQFGLLTPVFFWWIARSFENLYARCIAFGDPRHCLVYVGLSAGLHWFIAQGVEAAFVPCVIYIVTPLVLLRVVARRSESVPAGLPHRQADFTRVGTR
jgi:hypothetical protein